MIHSGETKSRGKSRGLKARPKTRHLTAHVFSSVVPGTEITQQKHAPRNRKKHASPSLFRGRDAAKPHEIFKSRLSAGVAR